VLSDRLVDRIRAAGGEAITGETVGDILLDDAGAVSGVRSQPRAGGDARVFQAPVVFANASPFALESMLPSPARADFMAPYRDMPLSISLFSIALGLDRLPAELGLSAYSTMIIPPWMQRLTDFRDSAALLADRPGAQMPAFGVVDYSRIDSGIAGDGLYPVSVVGADRLSNWEGLSEDDYRARKEAWLDAIVARLDAEWPGFAAAVVQRDMATARTMRDYLNTPGGAVYGFAPDVPARLPLTGPPRTPRTAVAGLWLASAFGGFGGFSGAMGTGGAAAKAALRESR
jgi:phytoene dehydrogenase-like protein